jgi:hypothetical protein
MSATAAVSPSAALSAMRRIWSGRRLATLSGWAATTASVAARSPVAHAASRRWLGEAWRSRSARISSLPYRAAASMAGVLAANKGRAAIEAFRAQPGGDRRPP